jgi:hypothetical protein
MPPLRKTSRHISLMLYCKMKESDYTTHMKKAQVLTVEQYSQYKRDRRMDILQLLWRLQELSR